MTPRTQVLVGGAVAVLVLDLVASLASLAIGFPYGHAAIASLLLYAVIGFLAARARGNEDPARAAAFAGAVAGATDATLGWVLSSSLGAGRVHPGGMSLPALLSIVAAGILIAGTTAVFGASIGRGPDGSATRRA